VSVPPNEFAKLARDGFFANYAVMAQYGNTMLNVQSFEQALAALVAVVENAATVRAARESGNARLSWDKLERRLRRSARRITHLFQVASARELRNELEGKVDGELLEEITPLVEWRNFLAHSYLMARLVTPGRTKLNPQQAHLDELAELATAFNAAVQHIYGAVQAIVSSLSPPIVEPGEEDAAEAFRAGLVTLVRQLVLAQPAPFSAGQATDTASDDEPDARL
jgi:hypothetical protein